MPSDNEANSSPSSTTAVKEIQSTGVHRYLRYLVLVLTAAVIPVLKITLALRVLPCVNDVVEWDGTMIGNVTEARRVTEGETTLFVISMVTLISAVVGMSCGLFFLIGLGETQRYNNLYVESYVRSHFLIFTIQAVAILIGVYHLELLLHVIVHMYSVLCAEVLGLVAIGWLVYEETKLVQELEKSGEYLNGFTMIRIV